MNEQLILSAPDYQLRVPRRVQLSIAAAFVGGLLSIFLLREGQPVLAGILSGAGVLAAVFGLFLRLLLNRRRRERAVRLMVASLTWEGSEQVLDVGCGNGIVLLAAAKHLTPGQGHATGIDVWDPTAGQQNAQTLRNNAELEGVSDRISVQQVDARRMPFDDAAFDVIFASLSLHHMGNRDDRKRALREMLRVLKPGGAVLIYDVFAIAKQAARLARELGAADTQWLNGSLVRTLRIQKPTA